MTGVITCKMKMRRKLRVGMQLKVQVARCLWLVASSSNLNVWYSGYRYGKSLIPVSAEDEDAMKLSADKCLSLLGFTAMKNVC